MHILQRLKTLLIITLLAFTASGVVSAKSASGLQNFTGGLHQEKTLSNSLWHQAKIGISNEVTSGYTVPSKGGDSIQAILHTKKKFGNFNIGSMSRSKMDEVGQAWVGPNAKPMMKKDQLIGYTSQDGLKTYRLPQLKQRGVAAGQTQGNLTEYVIDNGNKTVIRNAHIDLIP